MVSDYAPTGDQPEAIAQLLASIRHGSKHNTLLGVTGSGKTFTVANVISQLNRPTLVLSHNKTQERLFAKLNLYKNTCFT